MVLPTGRFLVRSFRCYLDIDQLNERMTVVGQCIQQKPSIRQVRAMTDER